MSGTARERLKSEAFRAQVRQRLAAGWSIARIMKETGKSYRHINQIAEQEKAAIKEPSE